MTRLNCADLQRRAEDVLRRAATAPEKVYGTENAEATIALIALARRLTAALQESRDDCAAHVPYGDARRKIHDEMMDRCDEALAAAREAKL